MKIIFYFIAVMLLFPLTSFSQNKTLPIYDEQKTHILITSTQPEFKIQLKSNPTTGYSWFLAPYNQAHIELLSHQFRASSTKMMGAPGYEVWIFKLKSAAFSTAQPILLQFNYLRPWEKNQPPAHHLIFQISTTTQS